jgi:fatty acid desaturase
MAERWRDALSDTEMADLMRIRDTRAWLSIALDWALVVAAFALVARWPNPLTVVVALFVIGGRQLGLAVLMHEASHRTLLRNRRWNDFVGNWICAYPIWSDLYPYRPYHLRHHAKNWTEDDPDLALAMPFPVSRTSMRRKIVRDLSGRTGWKRLRATVRRDLGISKGRAKRNFDAGIEALKGVVVTNVLLLGILVALGHPALYLLWVGAWLTTYSLAMRIRSIAEHGMVPDPRDDMQNSRTTLARWWERLLLAPNRVNFHLEHHLVMAMPHYSLPRMHRLLRERGVLEDANVTRGYLEVLRLASAAPPSGLATAG